MPHKRRKKQSGGGGGSTPLALSYGPTQTLLLTYYRQITRLTNLVNLILPDRLKLFVDSVLIASLSADPITLRDEPPLRSDQLTTKDVSWAICRVKPRPVRLATNGVCVGADYQSSS